MDKLNFKDKDKDKDREHFSHELSPYDLFQKIHKLTNPNRYRNSCPSPDRVGIHIDTNIGGITYAPM